MYVYFFLLDSFFLVQTSYEDKQDIQLMRFADYFARAFSSVSASQFPWTKTIKESSVAKISDVSFISSSFEIEYYMTVTSHN